MAKFRLFSILVLLIAFNTGCSTLSEKKNTPKYVFYFIGDGLGIQQVNATQAFLAAKEGNIGNSELSFSNFPATGFSTTYAATRYITGSAAAGTALSTGNKTSINTIGLSANHNDTIFSIAYHAHSKGIPVGIVTSVSIDHATPAAFYAHQPSRDMYHEIAHDLIYSGYRFFAGGGFIDPSGRKSNHPKGNVFEVGKEKGVFFTESTVVDDSIKEKYKTIVYSCPNPADGKSLHYHIDKDENYVSLADLTAMAINVLDNPKGFFLMVEGGKIDWACHHNDGAATIAEIISFSDAIAIAVEFYKRNPKETLIVVTSDHETGGMSLGNRFYGYDSNIALLANQKESFENFNRKVLRFKEQRKVKPTFNEVLDFILQELNIPKNGIELNELQKYNLNRAYNFSFGYQKPTQVDMIADEYGTYDPLTVAAIQILNQKAGIGWTTFSHTGGQVPIYALGVGQDLFVGQLDNTDIPKRIAKLMQLPFYK